MVSTSTQTGWPAKDAIRCSQCAREIRGGIDLKPSVNPEQRESKDDVSQDGAKQPPEQALAPVIHQRIVVPVIVPCCVPGQGVHGFGGGMLPGQYYKAAVDAAVARAGPMP